MISIVRIIILFVITSLSWRCTYQYVQRHSVVLNDSRTYRGYVKVKKRKSVIGQNLLVLGRIIDDHNYGVVNAEVSVGRTTKDMTDFDGIFDVVVTSTSLDDTLRVEYLGFRRVSVPIVDVIDRYIEIKLIPEYINH